MARIYDEEKAEKIAQIKQKNIDYFTANREQIILSANAAISTENYQSAISQTSRYLVSGDKTLENINSLAKKEFEKLQNTTKTKQLLTELRKVPASKYMENKKLYQQLVSLHPNNKKYKRNPKTI